MADVLFVMGSGRSGSTALERLLVSHENTVAVGEVGHPSVWRSGFDEERLCTCGKTIRDCPFWSAVRAEAFGASGAGAGSVAAVGRMRHFLALRHPTLRSSRFRATLPGAQTTVRRLYEAIAGAAGGRIIVDTTKSPSWGRLLSSIDGLRVAYVHLVRDSRAVAFSQQRRHARPDVWWTREEMPVTRPLRAALRWDMRFATSLAVVRSVGPAAFQMRYEDFVASPDDAVRRIDTHLRSLGMSGLGARTDSADRHHSVLGNPMRFEKEFVVRADTQWRTDMPGWQRALVTTMTSPFLAMHATRAGFRRYEDATRA